MSSGDFASELEQSVQHRLADLADAAAAAKARIGEGIADARPAQVVPRRAAVSFDDHDEMNGDEMSFSSQPQPPAEMSFDDPMIESGEMDEDGIPVWEDPP